MAQPGENRSRVKEILALVFGILAILISCCCTYLGIGLGIAGIVMAVLSKNDNNGRLAARTVADMAARQAAGKVAADKADC